MLTADRRRAEGRATPLVQMLQPTPDGGVTPLVKDVVDIIDKLVATVAIVVAGIFAYVKFVKERLFRPRLEPEVAATLVSGHQHRFLRVTASVKNSGFSKVDLELAPSCLRVFGAATLPTGHADEPGWESIAILDVSARHDWVEPQEIMRQTWLVAIPPSSKVYPAYRIEFRLAGRKSEWYAETVVIPSEAVAPRSPMLLPDRPEEHDAPSRAEG